MIRVRRITGGSISVRGRGDGDGAAADDRGSAAAEVAVVLPGVVLVLGLCLGALQTVSQQVALTSAAEEAARSVGRGEDPGTASARIRGAAPDAALTVSQEGHSTCVSLASPSSFAPAGAAGMRLTARGCAWREDPYAP